MNQADSTCQHNENISAAGCRGVARRAGTEGTLWAASPGTPLWQPARWRPLEGTLGRIRRAMLKSRPWRSAPLPQQALHAACSGLPGSRNLSSEHATCVSGVHAEGYAAQVPTAEEGPVSVCVCLPMTSRFSACTIGGAAYVDPVQHPLGGFQGPCTPCFLTGP